MAASITLSASTFKATCLDIFDRLASGDLVSVTVTKRGKPIVQVEKARVETDQASAGFLKDRTLVPDDFDWEAFRDGADWDDHVSETDAPLRRGVAEA